MPTTATAGAGSGLPVPQRGVGGDAGAQERGDLAEVERVGDAEDVVLVDDDVGGVAALGDGAVPVDAAVGLRVASQAVLLLTGPAVVALAAGVDDRADPDAVADCVLGYVRSDLDHGAGDFVTDDLRVGDGTPVAADGVDVGVADAGVGDLDQDISRSDIAPGDGGRDQGLGG